MHGFRMTNHFRRTSTRLHTLGNVLILCLFDAKDKYQNHSNPIFSGHSQCSEGICCFSSHGERLPDTIDLDNLQRTTNLYKDAMTRPDNQEWAKAYQKEFNCFKDSIVFAVVWLPTREKALGTTTRLDYKIDNDVLEKRKARMCVRGISRN